MGGHFFLGAWPLRTGWRMRPHTAGVWAEGASLAGSGFRSQHLPALVRPPSLLPTSAGQHEHLLPFTDETLEVIMFPNVPSIYVERHGDTAWTSVFSRLPLNHKAPGRRGLGARGGDRSGVTRTP